MESILSELKMYLEAAAQIFMAISVLATVVVRLTPKESDNEKVEKAVEKVHKLIGYLPTIGVNPRTKKLEEALAEIKERK